MVVHYEDMFFQSLLMDFKEEFLELFDITINNESEIFLSSGGKDSKNNYWLNLDLKDNFNDFEEIKTHVISTKSFNSKNEFFHSLKDFDGDSYLYSITEDISLNKSLTKLDELILILIPLMYTKKDVYCLLSETVCLTNQINEIAIDDLKLIKASQYIIMKRFIDDEYLNYLLLEEINMESNVVELFNKIRENEILLDGKIEIARNMLNENFTVDEISQLTNLSNDEIKAII